MIEEGCLDNQEGYWVEDEEDGTEGFLDADDDAFWVYDEENYAWFQRRLQGRKMKRGFKGRRKGKRKGGKGSGGTRFFKKRKGKSHLADGTTDAGKQKDHGMMVGMTGPRTTPRSPMQPRAKERKERRAKGKGKYEKDGKEAPWMEQRNLPMLPRAVLRLLPQQPSSLTLTLLQPFLYGHRKSRSVHRAALDSYLDGFGFGVHEGNDIEGGRAGPDEVLRSVAFGIPQLRQRLSSPLPTPSRPSASRG